jgi:hypothetical protein
MNCVLTRARRSQIVGDPFPHLVIHEALEPRYYRQLAAEFPPAEIILNGRTPAGNSNVRYTANETLDDARIGPLWREFARYHASQEFFDRVRELFQPTLRELHPGLESSVGKPLSEWRSSIRFREPIRDIALDCQFTYGTPVDVRSRCIGPHVDREVALYAGLFYMRDDDDDSEGGDLELYRFNPGSEVFDPGSRRVPDERVTRCKTIRYAGNTLVFFPHSPRALHGVSPRSPTTFPRRHINIIGELATPVFDLSGLVAPAAAP